MVSTIDFVIRSSRSFKILLLALAYTHAVGRRKALKNVEGEFDFSKEDLKNFI